MSGGPAAGDPAAAACAGGRTHSGFSFGFLAVACTAGQPSCRDSKMFTLIDTYARCLAASWSTAHIPVSGDGCRERADTFTLTSWTSLHRMQHDVCRMSCTQSCCQCELHRAGQWVAAWLVIADRRCCQRGSRVDAMICGPTGSAHPKS